MNPVFRLRLGCSAAGRWAALSGLQSIHPSPVLLVLLAFLCHPCEQVLYGRGDWDIKRSAAEKQHEWGQHGVLWSLMQTSVWSEIWTEEKRCFVIGRRDGAVCAGAHIMTAPLLLSVKSWFPVNLQQLLPLLGSYWISAKSYYKSLFWSCHCPWDPGCSVPDW